MTIGKFLTGGAWAAMAAALALTSMPAGARENNRGWRTSPSEGQAPANSERQQARAEGAAAQRAPQAERPAPVAQQRSSQGWNRSERADRGQSRSDRRAETAQQRSGRDWSRSEQSGAVRGGWNAGNAPVVRPQPGRTYTDPNRNRTYDGRNNGGTWSRSDNDRNLRDRRDNDRTWRDRNGSYRDGYRDARRDYRRWDNRSWRNDRRYDWSRYRYANRDIYRLGRYYAPYRDYSYRRLSIGVFLNSLFYSDRYWLNDPWRYRLPEVYGPYRWVRYYDDALLVDLYSGEVVDVIHDFFW